MDNTLGVFTMKYSLHKEFHKNTVQLRYMAVLEETTVKSECL